MARRTRCVVSIFSACEPQPSDDLGGNEDTQNRVEIMAQVVQEVVEACQSNLDYQVRYGTL